MVKHGQEWSRVVSNTIFSLFQAPKCLQGVIMRPRLCTLQLTEDIGSGQAWSSMVKSGQEWSVTPFAAYFKHLCASNVYLLGLDLVHFSRLKVHSFIHIGSGQAL